MSIELDDESSVINLVTYEVIETEDSYALGMHARVDEEAAKAAGKSFLDVLGAELPDFIGCVVVVTGEDVDGMGRGFITARTMLPADATVDEPRLNRATQALLSKLISLLLPDAQIASVESMSREYLN